MAVSTINVWDARREQGFGFFEKTPSITVTNTSVQTGQLANVDDLRSTVDKLRLLRPDSPGLASAQKVLSTLTNQIYSALETPQATAAPKTSPSFGG